jgi:4-hydroxy-3-methylbut-2-enyl diphosphate reductase IspH
VNKIVQELLYGVARVGIRAGARAAESIAQDVEEAITTGAKNARRKVKKLADDEDAEVIPITVKAKVRR